MSLAAVDAINNLLQEELTRVWQDTGTTVFYITHDITEAIRSNRIRVMSRGPGSIVVKEFAIDIPRPRIGTEAEFYEIERTIEALIRHEVQGRGRDETYNAQGSIFLSGIPVAYDRCLGYFQPMAPKS